ncbi:MAG: hypothetical protein QNJ73_03245 [Gammaproteobacteria bacterium]|nr:hypothetical protein [Gammaproteobacteria bacterium]
MKSVRKQLIGAVVAWVAVLPSAAAYGIEILAPINPDSISLRGFNENNDLVFEQVATAGFTLGISFRGVFDGSAAAQITGDAQNYQAFGISNGLTEAAADLTVGLDTPSFSGFTTSNVAIIVNEVMPGTFNSQLTGGFQFDVTTATVEILGREFRPSSGAFEFNSTFADPDSSIYERVSEDAQIAIDEASRELYETFNSVNPGFVTFNLSLVGPGPSAGLVAQTNNATLPGDVVQLLLIGAPSSVTIVPVPAVIWLFGSGLLSLLAFRRRVRV